MLFMAATIARRTLVRLGQKKGASVRPFAFMLVTTFTASPAFCQAAALLQRDEDPPNDFVTCQVDREDDLFPFGASYVSLTSSGETSSHNLLIAPYPPTQLALLFMRSWVTQLRKAAKIGNVAPFVSRYSDGAALLKENWKSLALGGFLDDAHSPGRRLDIRVETLRESPGGYGRRDRAHPEVCIPTLRTCVRVADRGYCLKS